MSLTPAEKAAGRVFRDLCQAQLAAMDGWDTAAFCSPYLVWYRHECIPSDRSVQVGTWAMPLKQQYWLSPEYRHCYCGKLGATNPETFPHWDCDGSAVAAEAGKFAFIWREGTCARCGLLVRSGSGRFVLAASHPPERGAVVAHREPAGQPVPANQAGAPHPPGLGGSAGG